MALPAVDRIAIAQEANRELLADVAIGAEDRYVHCSGLLLTASTSK
jgi:hypothetical protein